ncbi:MAG: energy transducer TonB [Pyrinomonadaceae bacterium]
MIRNRKLLGSMLAIAFVTASPAAIFSQQKPDEAPTTFQRERIPMGPDVPQPMRQMDDTFFYVTSEMSFDGKLVKGAPYSAQAVTEMTQMLIDGNRIVNKSSASIYRDNEGRTRREQTLKAIGPYATGGEAPQTIFISDPVAGVHYVLDGRTHTARKMPAFRFEWKTPAPAQGGTRIPVQPQGPPPDGIVKMRTEGTFTVTAPPHSADTGLVMQYRTDSQKRGKPESLGKQLVEGVEAEGTRHTVTIQAGEIGNDRAIEIVDERWYSSELQTVIMTKHSDPRFGETVYRLTNISRGEQPRSLFEIPGDYTVKPTAVGYGSGAGSGIGTSVGGGVGSGGGGGVATTVGPGVVTSGRALAPINGGVLNGKAIILPAPEYPAIARAAKVSGAVSVQITIDEDGNVVSAEATSGHPLLKAAAVTAAREAKFSPTRLSGQPVKVQGVVVYNFPPE